MAAQKNALSEELALELEELFDIKKAKLRNEKNLTVEANEAQRDIRLLTLMFRDGIPDVRMQVNDDEAISWSQNSQQLIYTNGQVTQLLEGTSKEVLMRMRPFLKGLVKQAKSFFDN